MLKFPLFFNGKVEKWKFIKSATALARMACLCGLFGLCALCFGSVLFGSLKMEKKGGGSGGTWPWRVHGWSPPKPSKMPSFFHHFLDAFFNLFFCSI